MSTEALDLSINMGLIFNDLSEEAALKYVADDFVDYEAQAGCPERPVRLPGHRALGAQRVRGRQVGAPGQLLRG